LKRKRKKALKIDKVNIDATLIENLSSVNVGTKRAHDLETNALETELAQKESQLDDKATDERPNIRKRMRLNNESQL
jgi:hypothetical protein